MPIYASPEQFMRDRSDYARKGIARGRSVVAVVFSGGVLFVAENPSPTLHKVSEIYDRIGFAATGRYNEYENLRTAGIRLADVRGYSYDRGDVTGRWLANAYAQTLGSVFSEHSKPLEVELCVAEVGPPDGPTDGTADQLYRISYDGSMFDEPRFVVMGGVTEPISAALESTFTDGWDLPEALRACVTALGTGAEGVHRDLAPHLLEVAVLDRRLRGRTFRRMDDPAVAAILTAATAPASDGTSNDAPSNGEPPNDEPPNNEPPNDEPATDTAEQDGAGDPSGGQG